jgi:hypothetical protein|tara:strand:+ start:4010 stop:4744 length:735 start_codon:yes stop_codon:yes gene_type:complete
MKMKMLNRYIAFTILLCPVVAQAGANDNAILLDQSGDTLNLTIDQIGYGNKLCGSINSGDCATDWILTGSSVTMDIDMIGNLNQIFGPTLFDSTDVDLSMTGSSNIWDWNVGYGGSADSSVVDVAITGSSNTFDIDWGYNASSERLDMDLDITGGSNIWDINIDSEDVTWDVDVIGSSNNFATTQSDGAYQSITMEWIGSSGDIDILQTSGTCGGSVTSCYGVINADFDSENAVVNIKQQDTTD